MKRIKYLKSIAGPGDTGNPAVGRDVTVYDIWQVLQSGKRLYRAARLDQIVEDLAREGHLVMSQGESQHELVSALVNAKPGASIQSAEGQENANQFKRVSQPSAAQAAFLEICQMLDAAVVLAEPIVAGDPRTIWVQGYYRAASESNPEEIGLNVVNPFVADAIAICSADPIMAGIRMFHTIIHERNHQRFGGHDAEFLRGLEPALDAKIGPWFDQLRAKYAGSR